MRIYQEELSDVARYIEKHRHITLEDKKSDFERIMGQIRRFHEVGPDTQILEVGTGIGWFPVMCAVNGFSCRGLEISPQLVEYGREFGRRYGVEADIQLGNIEEDVLDESSYDVVLASSVFEHVQHWRNGLANVYRALKPGGVLYFISTNKFALRSGEFGFPLYGWLPNWMRYRLRIKCQGPDIMALGIDFNQFTYPMLRREFRRLGFSRILDRLDLVEPATLIRSTPLKRNYLRLCKRLPILKYPALTFLSTTNFICVK